MSEPVKPAMPAELWRQILASPPELSLETSIAGVPGSETTIDMSTNRIGRHAVAAAALYGEPFGLTREDVALIREAALEVFENEYAVHNDPDGDRASSAKQVRFASLAARIEALLPPEGT